MLGDTAIAVNPKDDRFKDLVGKFVIIPLANRKIKIITDDYADPEQGTGAVKITPAHDFNDYDVGIRNKLEVINIFTPDGKINDNAPDPYKGLDRFAARKLILEHLEEGKFLEKIEKLVNKVPYGDRSNSIIEPYLTEQWFVDAKTLAIKAKEVVNNGKTKFFPENWSKTYFQWMNNIEPWCISRQLWWGHQIPAWYGPDGKIFVAENEDECKKQAKEFYSKDVELKRDEDVLDTWFSSGLWPFATLGWPEKTPEVEKFYPTSVLVTGFDIIFFWVARMIMMGTQFLDKEPFKNIYVHALVRDEKGQKMSKSKGNVIDPLELIEKYSADALRFTLLSMASPGRDVKLSEDRVKGYRNFLNKIWNANNFLTQNKCDFGDVKKPENIKLTINKWILSELVKVKNDTENSLKNYRFDEAAKIIYQFVWHSFCDWYLELSKTVLNSENEEDIKELRQTSAYVFKEILIILHPFIPFVTEEIWLNNKLDKDGKDYLMHANWLEDDYHEKKSYDEINNIINFITSIRSFKNDLNIIPGSFIEISTENTNKEQLAEMMVGRSVLLRLDKSEVKAGEVLFSVKNLTVKDDLDVTRVKNVDLEIRSGEILGLAGVTGNGQTELLEALSGIRKVESGEIYLEGKKVSDSQNFLDPRELKDKGLAHVPEDRQRMGLVTDFKAYENLIFGYHDQQPFSKSSVLNHRDIISHSKKIMEEYDVRPQSPNLITSNFSGGNQQKIILSRELNENPKVLLVGQPTRGVDIGAIEFIHQRLIDMRDRGAAILLVSVELDEVLSLSDRIVVMFDGKIVGEKDNKNVTDRELGLLMAGVV